MRSTTAQSLRQVLHIVGALPQIVEQAVFFISRKAIKVSISWLRMPPPTWR